MTSQLRSSATAVIFYIFLLNISIAVYDASKPNSGILYQFPAESQRRPTRKVRHVAAINESRFEATLPAGIELLATLITNLSTKIDRLEAAFKEMFPTPSKQHSPPTPYVRTRQTFIHSDIDNIFTKCAKENMDSQVKDWDLFQAVKFNPQGHFPTIFDILKKDSSSVHWRDKNGDTALHIAAFRGDLCAVAALLKYGAAVNARAKNLTTPLHLAAFNNHVDAIELLVKCGADVNAMNAAGASPLSLAMVNNHTNSISQLLADGAHPDTKYGDGDTLLLKALRDGNFENAKKLTEYGASLSLKGKHGESPVSLAAQKGFTEILRTMLKYGKARDSEEIATALEMAKDESVVWVLADEFPSLFLGESGKNVLLHALKSGQVVKISFD